MSARAQSNVDAVARAILGGEPGDAEELADARNAAVDVLAVFAAMDRDAGRAPLEGFEIPAVEATRPTLIAHVVPAATRPGELSLRLRPTERSWASFLEALRFEGFEAGDVVRIQVVR